MKDPISSLFREERHQEENTVKVFLGNEEIFCWDDETNADYPEDMTWSRTIKYVFYEGVRLGMAMATEGAKVK